MTAVLHQLNSWLKTSDSFPTHFLSQHCPLQRAAKEAQQTGSQALLLRLLTEGGLFQSFADECDGTYPSPWDTPAHHRPAALLNARRDLLLAALGDNPLQRLRQCMKAIQAATSSRPVPQLQHVWGSPGRFQQTELCSRLATHVPNEVRLFKQLAEEFGGWNPALLSTAGAT